MLAAAIVAALAAGFCNGLTAVLQQGATKRLEGRRSLPPRQFAWLVRQPRWLAGQASDIVALLLQAVALSFGALIFVEPMLVMALPFAVFLRALAARQRPGGRALLGAGLCVVGLSAFLTIARPRAGDPTLTLSEALPLSAGLAAVLVGFLLLALFVRRRNWRAVSFALGAATTFGVSAGLIKVVTSQLERGLLVPLAHWPLYAAILTGLAGVVLTQNALKPGALAAPVAVIMLGDPLVGIAVGLLWLGESINHAPWAVALEVVTLAVMAWGVAILAGQSPDVAAPTGRDAEHAPS